MWPGPSAWVMISGRPANMRFQAPFKRHGGDVHLRVFPEQDVVREVDAVAGGEVHVGDRDIEALDLAGGVADLELGHVLAGGQLGPAAVRGGRQA